MAISVWLALINVGSESENEGESENESAVLHKMIP